MRLLRTIGNVDFTGQERAAHNKLTMPTERNHASETFLFNRPHDLLSTRSMPAFSGRELRSPPQRGSAVKNNDLTEAIRGASPKTCTG